MIPAARRRGASPVPTPPTRLDLVAEVAPVNSAATWGHSR